MSIEDKIAKLEKKLYEISKEIYELGYEEFRPLHPFILVRVLPKDHVSEGGILLPDTAQNKPVYEAIVIKTWASYDEDRHRKVPTNYCIKCGREKSNEMHGEHSTHEFDPIMNIEIFSVHHECSVKPGQRIAFPHYEGIAFPYGTSRNSKDSFYKLIREGNDQNHYPYMNVLGVLEYTGDKDTIRKIEELTKKISSITTSGVPESRGAR